MGFKKYALRALYFSKEKTEKKEKETAIRLGAECCEYKVFDKKILRDSMILREQGFKTGGIFTKNLKTQLFYQNPKGLTLEQEHESPEFCSLFLFLVD